MVNKTRNPIIHLRSAIRALEVQMQGEIEAIRTGYRHQIELLEQSVAALEGRNHNGSSPKVTAARSPRSLSPRVGQDKIATVLEYVREHPYARQATIAEELEYNTGIVSMALHHLWQLGQVERCPKVHGSTTWNYVEDVTREDGHARGEVERSKRAQMTKG